MTQAFLTLLLFLFMKICSAKNYITLLGSNNVTVDSGTTLKIAWKLNLDPKEKIVLFICGYYVEGKFVTLMHTYEPRENMFVSSAIEKAPAVYHLNYDDPNKLAKRMVGYTDQNKKNTYALEIWKILEVFNEKKLSCNLHYRPGSFQPTKLASGGAISIHIKGIAPEKTVSYGLATTGKKVNSSKMFLLGSCLAAIILGVGLVIAYVCQKRQKYKRVPTSEREVKKDLEKMNTKIKPPPRPPAPPAITTERKQEQIIPPRPSKAVNQGTDSSKPAKFPESIDNPDSQNKRRREPGTSRRHRSRPPNLTPEMGKESRQASSNNSANNGERSRRNDDIERNSGERTRRPRTSEKSRRPRRPPSPSQSPYENVPPPTQPTAPKPTVDAASCSNDLSKDE